MPHLVKPRRAERRFKVNFEAMRPRTSRQFDIARSRIDIARRADRNKGIARRKRRLDAHHVVRHLAEPDDVGAQPVGRAARRAAMRAAQIARPARWRTARQTQRAEQFTVHVDDLGRTAALVEVVNVLRDDHHRARQRRLQLRQCDMRRVGVDDCQRGTAQVIEALHIGGRPRERFRCGDILDAAAFPQPVGAAEGGNTRFGRDSGAGEVDD